MTSVPKSFLDSLSFRLLTFFGAKDFLAVRGGEAFKNQKSTFFIREYEVGFLVPFTLWVISVVREESLEETAKELNFNHQDMDGYSLGYDEAMKMILRQILLDKTPYPWHETIQQAFGDLSRGLVKHRKALEHEEALKEDWERENQKYGWEEALPPLDAEEENA